MTAKHVFLSYIREDKALVDELQGILEAADFKVWRDTSDLWPGDNWELKIREAIQGGAIVFLACFSSALDARNTSYQYAELMIAADEYRLRPLDTSWLMTVRFDECDIPAVDLGGGRYLNRTIHRLDLFGEQKSANQARLITAIHRVMESSPGIPSPVILDAVASAKRADNGIDRLRDLIRNPTLVMDYDEYLASLRRPVLETLSDRTRYPIQAEGGQPIDPPMTLAWIDRILDYEAVVAPMLEPLKLIARYGQAEQQSELTKTIQAFGQESSQPTGLNLFRYVHEYPAIVITYVTTIAALTKANYGMLRAATEEAAVSLPNNIRLPFIATAGVASVVGDWNWLGSVLCKRDEGVPLDEDLVIALHAGRVGGRYTPISDHIYTLLAPLFEADFSGDEDYAEAFDRAEILMDAIGADARSQIKAYYGRRPGYGRYTWRHRYVDEPPEQQMLNEAEAAGPGWTPVLSGLFGGSSERAVAALTTVCKDAAHLRSNRF
ncbi:toll/interleukin-1 receptor domain-containing protein [uncultured Microbacterium sp.]|uniref:toll/interleukin-1 receptor domain-containing protein n=1 Tax=uncultured Microbacterium sp. TaxID=191216 RepID=UPI0035C97FDE